MPGLQSDPPETPHPHNHHRPGMSKNSDMLLYIDVRKPTDTFVDFRPQITPDLTVILTCSIFAVHQQRMLWDLEFQWTLWWIPRTT